MSNPWTFWRHYEGISQYTALIGKDHLTSNIEQKGLCSEEAGSVLSMLCTNHAMEMLSLLLQCNQIWRRRRKP